MKSFELFLEEKANKKTYEFLLDEIASTVTKNRVCFEQLLNEVGWNPFSRPTPAGHDDIETARKAIVNLINAQKAHIKNNPQMKGYYAPKIEELNKIASYLKGGLNGDLASQFFDPWQAYAAHQMTGHEYRRGDFVPRNRQQSNHPLNQGKRFGRTPSRGFVDSALKKSRGNPYANQNVPGSGTVNTNTYTQQNPAGSSTVNTNQPQPQQSQSQQYSTNQSTWNVDPQGTVYTNQGWPNNVNPTYSPNPVDPNVNVTTHSYSPEEEEARKLQLQKAYGESFLEWLKKNISR